MQIVLPIQFVRMNVFISDTDNSNVLVNGVRDASVYFDYLLYLSLIVLLLPL